MNSTMTLLNIGRVVLVLAGLVLVCSCEKKEETADNASLKVTELPGSAQSTVQPVDNCDRSLLWSSINGLSTNSDVGWFDDLAACDEVKLRSAAYSVLADGAPGGVKMLKRLQEVETDSATQSEFNAKMNAIKDVLKSDPLPKSMP